MEYGYSVAGFVVGSLVGATGVGGGSLMTPILLLVFGISPTTAVGTDLLFASVTKAVGTGVHGLNQSVSWRMVGRLCAGSLPAAALTLWALQHTVDKKSLAKTITVGLGFALVVTALAIALQPFLSRALRKGRTPSEFPKADEKSETEIRQIEEECELRVDAGWKTVTVGVVLGALVTLTSVGAGALGVMVLMALYPKVRSVRVVGSDIAHAVPLTLLAGMGHASLGGVDFPLLGALLIGSVPGIIIGSHLAIRLPERAMKLLLAAILLFVGAKLALPAVSEMA